MRVLARSRIWRQCHNELCALQCFESRWRRDVMLRLDTAEHDETFQARSEHVSDVQARAMQHTATHCAPRKRASEMSTDSVATIRQIPQRCAGQVGNCRSNQAQICK